MTQTHEEELPQSPEHQIALKLTLDTLRADHEVTAEEEAITREVIALLIETELPVFDKIPEITSSTNRSARSKLEFLKGISEIRDNLIPDQLLIYHQLPYELTDDILLVAPWVNMIHAWAKVLNYANTVGAIQSGEVPLEVQYLAAIAHEVYKFTTDYHDEKLLRPDEYFIDGRKYPETVFRESDTAGVNPGRHVNLPEMLYILRTLKDAFPKTDQ